MYIHCVITCCLYELLWSHLWIHGIKNPAFIRHRLKFQDRGTMPLSVPLRACSIIVKHNLRAKIFLLFLRHFLSVKVIFIYFFVLLLLLSPYLLHLLPNLYMFSRSSLVNCELVDLISDLELSKASLSCLF